MLQRASLFSTLPVHTVLVAFMNMTGKSMQYTWLIQHLGDLLFAVLHGSSPAVGIHVRSKTLKLVHLRFRHFRRSWLISVQMIRRGSNISFDSSFIRPIIAPT